MIGNLLKSILIAVFFSGILGAGLYFKLSNQVNENKIITVAPDKLFGWKFPVAKFPSTGSGKQLAYSDIRDPGGIPQGLPVRLKIPIIGVDSAIEDALITPDGRMDVPEGSKNVAWFSLGPHPGQTGSAVIGGHFGIEKEVPFVFYNLDKLRIGDKIYILDDKGDTLAFQVKKIESFDRNADSVTVFTSSDGLSHLNLITCEGIWNQVNGNYPQRLVIFTDGIPSEGAVVVKKTKVADTTVVYPTPSVSPEPKEILSTLTNPVSTRSVPFASPQILIASAKSLYATPLDGLITSLLLLSIAFLAFKVIRRQYVYS